MSRTVRDSIDLFRRKLLPRSLFGRALLILVIPTVIVQTLSTYIFYERHWSNVSRHMSYSLAGEIALLVHEIGNGGDSRRAELFNLADALMKITVTFEEGGKITLSEVKDPDLEYFVKEIERLIPSPFTIERTGEDREWIKIRIAVEGGVLTLTVSEKRLVSPTTYIFITWMVGLALLLLLIATLFMRNQIRPISRLAEAAESFGRGKEIPGFRPQGATEVRKAARAFIVMRERLKRQIATRTEMLAGISHDLRTPLTRMKLQLAMLGDSQEINELTADLTEMEHMIQEYLDFARGESKEEAVPVSISEFLSEIADNYRRQGHEIGIFVEDEREVFLRRQGFRRCINNLVDNALRYGKHCAITARATAGYLELWIDDDGPGIAPEHRDIVFRPFKRLDPSRNAKTGGVGLGLSIARDAVLSQGGRIELGESPVQGLRVIIRLPL